ncbi:MAG: DNA-3-methyladenine glycosylase I [Pseudomonadota bacterium]
MRPYEEILDLAASHHGGREAVLAKIENEHAVSDPKSVSDADYLRWMTRVVFGAGFSAKVIMNKWDNFEAAFTRFDAHRVAFFNDEDMDRLLSDKGIVRNGAKIKATIENARMMTEIIKTHGSFGAFLAEQSDGGQAELLAYLAKHGSRLSGTTAQYFLRYAGYDGWIATSDVCAAIVRESVLDRPKATSKTAVRAIDEAVETLAAQGGVSRATASKLLALSVG